MTNKKFQCSHCSKEFKYDSERKRHELSHDVPKFQCKVCEKHFTFISALRRHEKQHERTGRVKCSECGREFRDSVLLTRHTKYAHGETYTCKCSATFSSELALRSHMKTHKVSAEKKYRCRYQGCNKSFNFSHHLKHHELTHTNSKQYYCKTCGKGFIQAYNFKAHLKTHADDPSLYCEFPNCNKKFATLHSKKRHQVLNHAASAATCDQVIKKSQNYKSNLLNSNGNLNETELNNIDILTENKGDSKLTNRSNKIDAKEALTNNNCEIAIGGCIMKETEDTCVCNQITDANDSNCEFEPIENQVVTIDKFNINANVCGECKCSGHCGVNNTETEDVPLVEYNTDGTVKVRVSFDIDFPLETERKDKIDTKSIPFNSCKAVLGNCIVSGDGNMDEGCLCARMAMNDQVTAQEIEDITPHPTEIFS